MQKKQSKSLRRNIGKIWKIWQGRNMRKKYLEEESCQEDLQQENYSDGQTRDMTKNTGEDWRRIGDGGRESNETMRIDEESMEIWPNEVCDTSTILMVSTAPKSP